MEVKWYNSNESSIFLEEDDIDDYPNASLSCMKDFINYILPEKHEYYNTLKDLIMSGNKDNLKIAFEIIKTI